MPCDMLGWLHVVLEGDDSLVGNFNKLDCELVAGYSSPFVIWRELDIVDRKSGGPKELFEGVIRYRVFRDSTMFVAGEEEIVLEHELASDKRTTKHRLTAAVTPSFSP